MRHLSPILSFILGLSNQASDISSAQQPFIATVLDSAGMEYGTWVSDSLGSRPIFHSLLGCVIRQITLSYLCFFTSKVERQQYPLCRL